MISSPFLVKVDTETCIGCETCLERCQMEALSIEEEHAVLDADRCIGCGLCVSTCPSGALTLERKPQETQPGIPRNQMESFALRLNARNKAKADLKDKLVRHEKV
jgi:electron transport complex protein RnfB